LNLLVFIYLLLFSEIGKEVEFVQLSVGDSFGEISLLTGLPRTVSAIAASDNTVLLRIRHEDFVEVLNLYQNIRFDILTLVAERLKETEKLSQQLADNHHHS